MINFKPLPSQERLRAILNYIPETGDVLWLVPPSKIPAGSKAGYLHGPYLYIGIDGDDYLLHRIIWKWMTGEDPAFDVDHRNLTKTENHWENLREATRSFNRCNTRVRRDNKLGVKGVSRIRPSSPRYRAQITINGRHHFLGHFETIDAASNAYAEAAERLHGEFARTA